MDIKEFSKLCDELAYLYGIVFQQKARAKFLGVKANVEEKEQRIKELEKIIKDETKI